MYPGLCYSCSDCVGSPVFTWRTLYGYFPPCRQGASEALAPSTHSLLLLDHKLEESRDLDPNVVTVLAWAPNVRVLLNTVMDGQSIDPANLYLVLTVFLLQNDSLD